MLFVDIKAKSHWGFSEQAVLYSSSMTLNDTPGEKKTRNGCDGDTAVLNLMSAVCQGSCHLVNVDQKSHQVLSTHILYFALVMTGYKKY